MAISKQQSMRPAEIELIDASNQHESTLQAHAQSLETLDENLRTETTDRESADTALGTRIDDEVQARTDADTALGTRIDNEVQARTDADNDEVQARTDADTALGTRIDNEVQARTDADTALDTRIDGEVQARTDADTALDTRIDGEAQARTDADTALGTRVDDEVQARTDADTALDTSIADLRNSVSQLKPLDIPGAANKGIPLGDTMILWVDPQQKTLGIDQLIDDTWTRNSTFVSGIQFVTANSVQFIRYESPDRVEIHIGFDDSYVGIGILDDGTIWVIKDGQVVKTI
jgi:hypothetical protein